MENYYDTQMERWRKRRERIRKLAEGKTPKGKIAKQFGISPSRVSHILKAAAKAGNGTA